MAVNDNADDYANDRVGIFFPASSNGTLDDGDLTGQCVSLDKWFLAEMCSVPNPGQARGNARVFGDTLVAQGLADIVTDPQRGDIAVWKLDGGSDSNGSTNGHTGVVLSNNRVFEENAALTGTPSEEVPDGNNGFTKVYAARIDPLYASWRKGSAIFYRVRSYIENVNQGDEMVTPNELTAMFKAFRNRYPSQAEVDQFVGKISFIAMVDMLDSGPERADTINKLAVGTVAVDDNWQQLLTDLTTQVETLKTQAILPPPDNTIITPINTPIVNPQPSATIEPTPKQSLVSKFIAWLFKKG